MNITVSLTTGWREIMIEYKVEQHGNDPMWRNNSSNSSYSLWIYPSMIHCLFTSRAPENRLFLLCTWTLFLGIQTSTCCLSIFWKTSYSVAIMKCCNLLVPASYGTGILWRNLRKRRQCLYRCLPLSNWEQEENLPVDTNQRHNVHWRQQFQCKDIPTVHYSPSWTAGGRQRRR